MLEEEKNAAEDTALSEAYRSIKNCEELLEKGQR